VEAQMTHEQLRDAARRIWNTFNAHDLDDHAGLPVSPEFENANALPDTPPGPEGMRQVAQRLYSAFPDMRFEIEEIFVAEQRVATLGWMSGTQEGQFGPYPPGGKAFRVRQIHTYGFDEQGRIANHVAVRDDIAMLQQLGHLPVG
jgi:steroid delta-isomerase-like uncharacterized protein